MQTLFGKDYYVILRPSLCFDFPEKHNDNNNIIIFSIIFCIVILLCVIFIIWKFIKIKINRKEFNFENLKEELLFKK